MYPNPVIERRIECALVMLASVLVYDQLAFSWYFFAALFFIPDLSLLFYVKGPRVGGIAYNLAHCFVGPIVLGVYSWLSGDIMIQQISLIWMAHCAFDRAIGWGLKYPDSFCHTDMGVKTLPVDNTYLR